MSHHSTQTVTGAWFDGATSAMQSAELTFSEDGTVTLTIEAQPRERVPFAQLTVSPRLGNTPRYIYFDGGGKFETRNNDEVDRWQRQTRGGVWDSWVHRWESQWHMVLGSLLVLVFSVWVVMVYGLPAASHKIAFWLPDEIPQVVGTHALETLDDAFFQPSRLSEQERQRVLDHFQPALDHYSDLPLKVLFREGGSIGPNAFALPDGTLVFTDEMVALSRDDDELLAVLAHEIGHVAERHSLQALVRTSMMGFVLMMVTGDVSASSEILLAVPLFMMELSHSRKFESQADDFALQYLKAEQIDPSHFVQIMSRLESARSCLSPIEKRADSEESERSADQEPSNEEALSSETAQQELVDVNDQLGCFRTLENTSRASLDVEDEESDWMDYLSSHPSTDDRLEKFRQP